MTEDEKKIAEAIRKSVDVRLPEDFADRLVERLREERKEPRVRGVLGEGMARAILIAASVTLLLGFVPTVLDRHDSERDARVAHCGTIRPADSDKPQSDSRLNGLALFGLCREAVRRRVKPLVRRFCRREDEE